MNLETVISNNVDEKWWNKTLTQNNASTVYQTTNWSKVYQDSYGSKPVFIYVKNSSGNIVGQLSALIHNKYFWDHSNYLARIFGEKFSLNTLLNWHYGPIIHEYENQHEIISAILSALDTIASENNVIMIRGSSPPLGIQLLDKQFKENNYELTQWGTYVTYLNQKPENYFKSLDKKIRYDIRKGEQNKLEFEIVEERTALTEFTKMGIESRERLGESRVLNSKRLDFDWKHLYENGLLKVFLARHKGNVISGIWNIIFNGNVIQHGVANSPDQSIRGGSFLTWNAIKWCMKNKNLTYDMGGVNPNPANEKEININFYKSKWAEKKFDYCIFTKLRNKTMWKLLKTIKNPKNALDKITKILTNSV